MGTETWVRVWEDGLVERLNDDGEWEPVVVTTWPYLVALGYVRVTLT